MAAPNTLISNCITFYDNSDPSGAENARRRARLLNILQRGYKYVWSFSEWEWTFSETQFQVVAGNNNVTLVIAAPNWLEFGRNGYLHNKTSNLPMREKPKGLVQRIRAANAGSGDQNSRYFAIWNKSIQLPFTAPSATDFTIFYRVTADVLADNATAMTLPDKYADTVLLSYMMMWNQDLKNDMRKTWQQEYVQGLSQMLKQEQPEKTRNRRMPLAIQGAW